LPENYKEAVTELRENDEVAASIALRAQAERIKELEARCRIASRGLDALSVRLPMAERPNSFGYVYHNPDAGTEWAEQHPVDSGEVPDATDIQAADLAVLHSNLMLAWQENAILRTEKHADAEAIGALRDDLEGMRAEGKRMRREVEIARNDALREALSYMDNGDDVKLGGDHPDWFVHRYDSLKDLIEGGAND